MSQAQPSLVTNHHWPMLDMLRAIAALLVLLGHSRNWFFEGIDHVERPGLLLKAFWLVTVLQQEAVVVFFVLSGFLVGGSLIRALQAGRFNLTSYLVRRFARIYTVYFPAILLTYVVFLLGTLLLHDPGQGAIRPLFSELQLGLGGARMALCHLAGVQGFACGHWAQNPAFWSLGFEWVFYLVAPAVLGLLMGARNVWMRGVGLVSIGALVATVALAAGHDPASHAGKWMLWFLCWFLGVLSWWTLYTRPLRTLAGVLGIALLLAGMAVSRLKIVPDTATYTAVGVGTALALATPRVIGFELAPRVFAWLSSFSYSLYATHVPIIFLTIGVLQALGYPTSKLTPQPLTFLGYGVTLLTALTVGYLFALVTERNTERVRALLQSASRSAAVPAASVDEAFAPPFQVRDGA